MPNILTIDGVLQFGLEHGGQRHKDFTLRVATLEDVEVAIEEAGPDASNARMARHKWALCLTRLGSIPPEDITADLLADLPAQEFGIFKAAEDALTKKLMASSAEFSAASEK